MKKILLVIVLFLSSITIVFAKADENLNVIDSSDKEILYSIELEEEKLVDTGVKDDIGWTLYVDGEKVAKKKIDNNIAASITKGLHSIYLRYEFPFIHEIIITLCVFITSFSIKNLITIIKE